MLLENLYNEIFNQSRYYQYEVYKLKVVSWIINILSIPVFIV